MPSAVQVKTLVNSHYTGDDEQFNTVALQIAASEARQGHEQFAKELERLVDGAKKKESAKRIVSIQEPQGELHSLLSICGIYRYRPIFLKCSFTMNIFL